MLKTRRLAAAALAIVLVSTAAYGAGIFPGFPLVPSNEDLTGNETIPADTNLPSGLNPQTELLSPANIANYSRLINYGAFGNMLVGGDFGASPWTRGTSFTQSNGSTTPLYTADRWWSSASGATTISKQTGAASIVSGTSAALRMARLSGGLTSVQNNCVGQVLESEDSLIARGRSTTFSFYARAGTSLSSFSSRVSVLIRTGTGTDESSANFFAGTWTGVATTVSQTQALTSTWTRYQFTGTPAINTNQIGVQICVAFGEKEAIAGASDFVELAQVQLETNSRAGAFNYRSPGLELMLAQRYATAINEAASGVDNGIGFFDTITTCAMSIPLPTDMRIVPTLDVSRGAWKLAAGSGVSIFPVITGITSGTGVGGVRNIQLAIAAAAGSQGTGTSCALRSQNGAGRLLLSSEL